MKILSSILLVLSLHIAFGKTKDVKKHPEVSKKGHAYVSSKRNWDYKKQEYEYIPAKWKKLPVELYYDPKEWKSPKHQILLAKKPLLKKKTKKPAGVIRRL